MRKLYSILSAALLSVFTLTATAQTTADIAGAYTLNAQPELFDSPDGLYLSSQYNININTCETSADSLLMDGFLGAAINNIEEAASTPLKGYYDAEAKTVTFEQQQPSIIYSMTTGFRMTLDGPVVLHVSTTADGDITLSTDTRVTFSGVVSEFELTGYVDPFSMQRHRTAKLTKEELLGTYALTYAPTNVMTTETMDEVTKLFTITEQNDSLFIYGLAGCASKLNVQLGETGFVIPSQMIRGADYTVQIVNANSYGDLNVSYSGNGTFVFSDGIYMVDTRLMTEDDWTAAYVVASTATAKKVIGADEVAGTYVLSAQPLLSGAPEGVSLPATYTITVTASETAADSLYIDGFLGMALDEQMQTSPLAGVYDAVNGTVTFTQEQTQYLVDMTTYGMSELDGPLVLTVGKDAEGNITLTSTDNVSFYFSVTDYSTYETVVVPGLFEPFVMTKKKTYTISEANLPGTYSFTYTLTPADGTDPYSATTTFTITSEDGKLYVNGLFGTNTKLELTYGENGFTLPATMDVNEDESINLILMSMAMGNVTIEYGENNTLVVPSDGIVIVTQELGGYHYIYSGTATKTGDAEGIEAVSASTADATGAVYTLDGRKLSGANSVKGLAKGLYIVGGKKVIVR